MKQILDDIDKINITVLVLSAVLTIGEVVTIIEDFAPVGGGVLNDGPTIAAAEACKAGIRQNARTAIKRQAKAMLQEQCWKIAN
jgi:hypothetical protein